MINIKHTQTDIDYLLSPQAIRDKSQRIYEKSLNGETHFQVHPEKFDDLADYVLSVIKENYPDLEIPFHSRWRHINAGGIDREKLLHDHINALESSNEPRAKLRRLLDFIIVSVLVDAGAGNEWSFTEEKYSLNTSRSEGLCVASFYLYRDLIKDAKSENILKIKQNEFDQVFQVSDKNPLLGTKGRLGLLQTLAEVSKNTDKFKIDSPSGFIFNLIDENTKTISALDLLKAVLINLGAIWPSRLKLGDTDMGDTWHYSEFGALSVDSLVPFHKLSQWLTYSLLEPIMQDGIQVTDVEKMTGLCEYRNGGLLVDFDYIQLRNKELLKKSHTPNSDLIIEWRALTLVTLDQLGKKIQGMLGKDENTFPLAKVLEGGTWWAGRKIANKLRPDGAPPIKIESDGTVF